MQTQHSLWRDIIVANNESAANMKAHNASTDEYSTVLRTLRDTYMRAHALQVRATLAQTWRTPADTACPTPTLPAPHMATLACRGDLR